MSVELLQTGSLACFIVAGLFLIAAIVLFFVLDVPALIGEVTGATERKAIENIRMQNEDTSEAKSVKANKAKKAVKPSAQPQMKEADGNPGTAKLSTAKLLTGSEGTTLLNTESNATTLLNAESNATTLLNTENNVAAFMNNGDSETTILSNQANVAMTMNSGDSETTILSQNIKTTGAYAQAQNETTVLSQDMQPISGFTATTAAPNVSIDTAVGFNVEVAFEYTSSPEIIE